MKRIIYFFLLITILYNYISSADTDCLANSGKNGKECGLKTTFINVAEWHFIHEEDLAYKCCYYKGKIDDKDYEGCFAFYEDDINNYKVNDLLDKMEKGEWELALGVINNNPSIDCFSRTIHNFNKIIFLFEIIIFLFF